METSVRRAPLAVGRRPVCKLVPRSSLSSIRIIVRFDVKKSDPLPVPMNPKNHSWQDYQEAAAAVFRDLGCTADVNKTVSGARSTHDVDVYVTFRQFGQECRWIVECKLWSKPVAKETVHALRDRVDDLGADRGVIFSESGFQAGARTAAQTTNILLQDSLEDFSETARFHMRRVALVLEEADEPDAEPVHKFPNRYR
ncbi:MAG: restriction endonuclease, partial [Chloroflexota bacterium]|nr:restriction endonuclease [Chloroflexota bacterium]